MRERSASGFRMRGDRCGSKPPLTELGDPRLPNMCAGRDHTTCNPNSTTRKPPTTVGASTAATTPHAPPPGNYENPQHRVLWHNAKRIKLATEMEFASWRMQVRCCSPMKGSRSEACFCRYPCAAPWAHVEIAPTLLWMAMLSLTYNGHCSVGAAPGRPAPGKAATRLALPSMTWVELGGGMQPQTRI